MDTKQEKTKIQNWMKILFWLVCLVFFAYSFITIMDLETIAHPGRQEHFIHILSVLSKPNLFDGETIRQVAIKMLETIQIGFLATTISTVIAIPFTFFSARPSSFLGRGFNFLLQPVLSAGRAVHPLITIVPLVIIAGIGPTAGVLALTIFSTAVLIGKFTEYAQLQMALSWPSLTKVHFPGLAFKHLPVNILIASVLGFMGGGGIGFFLQMNINLLDYRNAGVAILACIIVIGSLDLISRAVWHKIQNNRASFP